MEGRKEGYHKKRRREGQEREGDKDGVMVTYA